MAVEKRYPSTILATVCIPWDETYSFDRQLFCRQVDLLKSRGVHHLYLFGTAGEGYGVTDRQFEEIVKVFAREMQGEDLHPMVGVISLSLQTMLQRIEYAYAQGIRDFQISLPSWGALSDNEMREFFHRVCGPYSDCRFLVYNLMRAKRLLSVGEFMSLADEIPNLGGAKFTSADIPAMQEMAVGDSPLQFFLGERNYGIGSIFGEFGYLISLGSSSFEQAWKYFHAGRRKDTEQITRYMQELSSILREFIKIMGPGRIDGAYDKVFSKILDPQFPLRLLPPYQTSTEEQYMQYRSFLQKQYPQWLQT